jgi:deoxyribodipyrimidine photo-lyase
MVEPERITALNDKPEGRGAYVLYWMQQSQRAVHNPALEVAVRAANRLRVPVVVCFGLSESLAAANARHYTFMLQGLAETAARLRARGMAFIMRRMSPQQLALELGRRAALIVCDQGYLRGQKRWRAQVAAAATRRVLAVEGDVIVPLRVASAKAEIGARTLRGKLQAQLQQFLVPLSSPAVRVRAARLRLGGTLPLDDIGRLVATLRIDHSVGPTAFIGGHGQALRRLKSFVAQGLVGYRDRRPCLVQPRISRLSPYLHFGQISPVQIALAVMKARAPQADRTGFLEELIVRRELAANFVDATPNYDRYAALPGWARATLQRHSGDRRAYVYRYAQLAAGATHDPYWNAAMQEMRRSGFLHNYLRMYWGKKVLEWSASPEEGHAALLKLNNTYFLDGRDPSSYANVGWVFGLHDRPWPERPIFGNVRYMNAAGLRRKTDIEDYLKARAP